MKYLLCIFAFAFYMEARATHVSSAEMRYEYTGSGNLYTLYLTVIKMCEPGGDLLNTSEEIDIYSACQGIFSRQLPMVQGPDTLSTYCASYGNSCSQTGSVYPGFERRVYADTITLLPCVLWQFSWVGCCRAAGLSNLLNPTVEGTKIFMTLDNSLAHNTSAWLPNPHPLSVPQALVSTMPLYTVDPEKDSIAYEWFIPKNHNGGNLYYAPGGYSSIFPMGTGSALTINSSNSITILAPQVGKYALGLRINEYRNGQLIGYAERDFTLASIPTTNAAAPTVPVPTSTLNYITCPGSTQSINISFNDPVPTDSVYLTVSAPQLPGWTFNTIVTPGLGTASANISWTTPVYLNPKL